MAFFGVVGGDIGRFGDCMILIKCVGIIVCFFRRILQDLDIVIFGSLREGAEAALH